MKASRELLILSLLTSCFAFAEEAIRNPYHEEPLWRLWAETPEPLTLTIDGEERIFEVTPEEERRFPVLPEERPLLESPPFEGVAESTAAGTWDDAYMSLDHGHTNLRSPRGQFVVGPKVRHGNGETMIRLRMALGANFTSQSYARRGRHIVDDQANHLNTERHFYFANTVRATPAHASYKDNDAEAVHDDYDGLFSHSFQSVGQSGSEVRALEKMMLAGGAMRRGVKDELKRHGVYPSALLAIFKAALPLADAAGEPLPYEHELRHRPAYAASGEVGHPHWCSANVHYHGYDERRHLAAMIELADALESPPPVAILSCERLDVTRNGLTLVEGATSDPRVKSASLTQARVWGNPGETVAVTIDLSKSYDLGDRELEFSCRPLFEEHEHIVVEDLGGGRFRVTANHDPELPKGRQPVICVTRNGGPVPSNPVFLNFYWPEENERPDFLGVPLSRLSDAQREQLGADEWKEYPVTVNRRPVVSFGIAGEALRARAGETVRVPFKAGDPEGFPVRVFRRAGEVGEVGDGELVWEVPADAEPGLEAVHLVFADGTGGYTGRRVEFLVGPQQDELAEGWRVTTLGEPGFAAAVAVDGDGAVAFRDGPVEAAEPNRRRLDGTFAYREVAGDGDWILELPEEGELPLLELALRAGLDDHWRRATVRVGADGVSGNWKSGESYWGIRSSVGELDGRPRELRLARRGERVAGWARGDGQVWTQLFDVALEIEGGVLGVVHAGGPEVALRLREAEDGGLPLVRPESDRRGRIEAPVEVELVAPRDGVELRFTRDGSEPGEGSERYEEPLVIEEAGPLELRVRDGAGAEVRAQFEVEGAEE